MRSEIEKLLDEIDTELRPLVIAGTKYADELIITGKPEATDQILALFEKMCNEVISADELIAVEFGADSVNDVAEKALAAERNALRTTQHQALKTKLGEQSGLVGEVVEVDIEESKQAEGYLFDRPTTKEEKEDAVKRVRKQRDEWD